MKKNPKVDALFAIVRGLSDEDRKTFLADMTARAPDTSDIHRFLTTVVQEAPDVDDVPAMVLDVPPREPAHRGGTLRDVPVSAYDTEIARLVREPSNIPHDDAEAARRFARPIAQMRADVALLAAARSYGQAWQVLDEALYGSAGLDKDASSRFTSVPSAWMQRLGVANLAHRRATAHTTLLEALGIKVPQR